MTPVVPDWLTSEDPQQVWSGAMGSLDEALVALDEAAPADADYVAPRIAAASAGFAYLDREGFAAVSGVILAPLAEVTYALLRAVHSGDAEAIEAASLGVCCALDVDPAQLG